MWKIFIIILILICVCLFCSSFIVIKIKLSLDQAVKDKVIKYATPAIFGLCPSSWTRKKFTDNTYCIEYNSLGITDKDGNLIAAKLNLDCPGEYKDNYCVVEK